MPWKESVCCGDTGDHRQCVRVLGGGGSWKWPIRERPRILKALLQNAPNGIGRSHGCDAATAEDRELANPCEHSIAGRKSPQSGPRTTFLWSFSGCLGYPVPICPTNPFSTLSWICFLPQKDRVESIKLNFLVPHISQLLSGFGHWEPLLRGNRGREREDPGILPPALCLGLVPCQGLHLPKGSPSSFCVACCGSVFHHVVPGLGCQ